MNTLPPSSGYADGFTLVEMIGVLIIMSILMLIAVPRFFDRNTFDIRAFHDQSLAMLRYAQKNAIAQNRNVFVRLTSGSISACFDAACTAHVPAPGGKNSGSGDTLAACSNDATWFCEALPHGVTSVIAPTVFYFNPLGQPFSPTSPASPFTVALDFPLTGDGMTRHIYVEPETGYVHP